MKYIILIKFASLFTSRSTADSGGHKMALWVRMAATKSANLCATTTRLSLTSTHDN